MEIKREHFRAYKRVQESGMFNMLTPQAVNATGLDEDIYFEIVDRYSEFKEQFEGGE